MSRPFIVVGLLAIALAAQAQEDTMLTVRAGALRITIDAKGQVVGLHEFATGRPCLAAGRPAPLLGLVVPGKAVRLSAASWDARGTRLTLRCAATGVSAVVAVRRRPTHATFELVSVQGAKPTRIAWGPFPTSIGATVGTTVGVVRDEAFAIGIQALNIQTVGGAAGKRYGSDLYAYAIEHDGGVVGSRIALFGCAADQALATIGKIEVAEGLPHPMLDGVWGKVSPTARRSYFIVGFGEKNLDAVLDVARKGGFTYVYNPGPFKTWGHFQLNPALFPDGDASMKRCVERAAKHGIRLGVHTLTSFITTSDPYVTPVPDPRLARLGSTTLAAAIDAKATEIAVVDPAPFRQRQTLATAILGTELVQYQGVTVAAPWRLTGCTRGAFGTKASPHAAGADIGKLADHAYRTFYPGIANGMMDEMTARLIELFNTTGLRQMSFDGLEGLSTYGYGQYARHRFVTQCFAGWKGEVVTDASNLLHTLWHVHTRMNWGELTQSAKTDIDNYRARNCKYFEDNLFPTAMGWWRFGGAGLDWEATRLEDIEYLLAKAAGFDAAHGMQTQPAAIAAHGFGDRCLAMVKAWDQARYAAAFSPAQRAALRQKGRDFHLEPTGPGRWALTEMRYSPFFWMCPGTGRSQPGDPARRILSLNTATEERLGLECPVANPFAAQPLRFELRALGSFDYAHAANIDLTTRAPADFRPVPHKVADAPPLAIADAKVAGHKGYRLRASYEGKRKKSLPTRVVATLPKPLDLRKHRGLGLWVRGDGNGELLVVELTARSSVRQFYVPITFTGERYVEFPLAEACCGRYYAYKWDSFTPWHRTLKGFDYGHVDRIALGFNAVAAGQQVACSVAGIQALKELGGGLHNPTLELGGKRMTFACTLAPGHYLMYEGGEAADVRDANFRLVRTVAVGGERLSLAHGASRVRLAYSCSKGPAPWARVEFKACGVAQAVTARARR